MKAALLRCCKPFALTTFVLLANCGAPTSAQDDVASHDEHSLDSEMPLTSPEALDTDATLDEQNPERDAELTSSAPAEATPRGGCTPPGPGCSHILNGNAAGGRSILVQDNWCKNDDNIFVGDRLCDSGYAQNTLVPGQVSNYWQDWDAVKFPRGCYGYFSTGTGSGSRNYPVDRRGKVSIWLRVHNGETARVTMNCQ